MFGFKKKKKVNIFVEFFEVDASEPFASSEVPLEQLPETFEINTTMHLGSDDWAVIKAEPTYKHAFQELGSLKLFLQKVLQLDPQSLSYSQVDISEAIDDHLRLEAEDWITTIPINGMIDNPEAQGLPPLAADAEETYRIASKLSQIRESFETENDGVYCPICHIANNDRGKLQTPCPKCGWELLQFGWT